MEAEHQQFTKNKLRWFLLGSFHCIDVETASVAKNQKKTLVFRATTASASGDKLITPKWNCASIPQSIAVSDCCSQPHPAMGLIMGSLSSDNALGWGCPLGTSNYNVLWQGYKYPWSHRWSPHCRVLGRYVLCSLCLPGLGWRVVCKHGNLPGLCPGECETSEIS